MRAVIQRVEKAQVDVDGETVGAIGPGLLVLLGIRQSDTADQIGVLAKKLVNLRIFENEAGKMDRSLSDIEGAMLVVSQFTLFASVKKGRRPSFTEAARPEVAEPMYEAFAQAVRDQGVEVATGRFGAHMDVSLTNDGPVTLIVDTDDL